MEPSHSPLGMDETAAVRMPLQFYGANYGWREPKDDD